MFVPDYDITKVKPAIYNPRYLSNEAFSLLQQSLKKLGVLKPIIVREDNTIIAGHQRTKAMLALGIKAAPAFVINGINKMDEVRFNQMHNASDAELNELYSTVRMTGSVPLGWSWLDSKQIEVVNKGKLVKLLKAELKLLARYGDWGAVVADQDGNVIISPEYAIASKTLNRKLLVYGIENSKVNDVKYYFGQDYGVFSYQHLDKDTFIQTLAQKSRLRDANQRGGKSVLYETCVIPEINKQQSILDFGSGWGDYAKMLRRKGYNITDLEFYRRHKAINAINVDWVNMRISDILEDIQENGLYDVIVCDSVLNSVDSLEAEKSVMITLNAFCKPGGIVFWSGRCKEFVSHTVGDKSEFDSRPEKGTVSEDEMTMLYFFDENNFTANYREGRWFYQKMHTFEQVHELNRKYIGSQYSLTGKGRNIERPRQMKNTSSFQVTSIKDVEIDAQTVKEALKFEFSLILPNGKRYNRFDDVWNVFKQYYDN